MSIKRSISALSLLALLVCVPLGMAKNDKAKGKWKDRDRWEARDDYRYRDYRDRNSRLYDRDRYYRDRDYVGYGSSDRIRHRGMDRNHDGVITRREWRGNDNSFDRHDRNGDGRLSGREVRPGSRGRGRNSRYY